MKISDNSRYATLNRLEIYRKSKRLTKDVFLISKLINRDLASQMQRASISIGANIAEGY